MKPGLDLDKVAAALRRAGQAAAEGSQAARAGRFTATDAAKPAPAEIPGNAGRSRAAVKKANEALG